MKSPVLTTDTTSFRINWRDKDHPVWGIVKPIVNTCCLAGILWLTAADFDRTEIQTIVSMAMANFGLESVRARRK